MAPFSPRSPQLATSVMIILTPMTPLAARDVSGVVSSFISGTALASMTRAGGGEERRQEVTQATTLALSRGGCLRSGSRASRARHLDQGWINQYSFHISYCPDLSIWRFVRCWPDSGKLGVTSQCTSTRITLAVWFSSLKIGLSIY